MKLSIVSPVYRAEAIVSELTKRIEASVSEITDDYEIILVEDCGPDLSWLEIEAICEANERVKGIKLSRNFGQHYAITAGLDYSTGDYAIVLDCDLQDNPQDFAKLLEKAAEGYDVVFTTRRGRKHGIWRGGMSAIYKKVFSLISDERFAVNNGSLFLVSRQVMNAIGGLKERQRLIGQVIRWVGFPTTYVEVEHGERFAGNSSYSLSAQIRLAVEGWIAHSDRLLRLSIYAGLACATVSIVAALLIVALHFSVGFAVGWPSVITSILLSTGLILTSIGVCGLYVGKIFEEVKQRPLYVVQTILNGTLLSSDDKNRDRDCVKS